MLTAVRAFLVDLVVGTPDALQKFLLAQMARRGKVVKDNNIRPD